MSFHQISEPPYVMLIYHRFGLHQTGKTLKANLPKLRQPIEAELQPLYARTHAPRRQPIPRLAAIRQTQQRWFSSRSTSSTSQQFSSTAKSAAKYDRSSFPTSRISRAVAGLPGRAPFASTLRPNLTGGALGRTAGGYGAGAGRIGGARYFSHTPAAPAQVVANVSQAMRAFLLSGQKAQFEGMTPRKEKQFKTVTSVQEKTSRMLRSLPASVAGSYIDFKIAPTITAISPLGPSSAMGFSEDASLNNTNVMDNISVDFARAFKDLALVTKDLKSLATLGDLPLTLADSSTIRVRFPGCDADTVHRLCSELNIRRGLVYQDEDFDATNGTEMALLFPFAPSHTPSENTYPTHLRNDHSRGRDAIDWTTMLTPENRSPKDSIRSNLSHDFEVVSPEENPWLSSPSGFTSLHGEEDNGAAFFQPGGAEVPDSLQYEGLEGIYRFLEECDRVRR